MGLLYDRDINLVVAFSLVVSLLALPVFWLAKNAPLPESAST